MTDKLDLIGQKVEALASRLSDVEGENARLRQTNSDLSEELARLKKDYQALRVENADRTDAVKTKLSGVLNRLAELEGAVGQDFS
jgi:predicted nuclease with TOPRIM domain